VKKTASTSASKTPSVLYRLLRELALVVMLFKVI
jgi:hypothetical protein